MTVISDNLGEGALRSHRPCRIQPASAYTGGWESCLTLPCLRFQGVLRLAWPTLAVPHVTCCEFSAHWLSMSLLELAVLRVKALMDRRQPAHCRSILQAVFVLCISR